MFAMKNWLCFAALTVFLCVLAFTGCGKKNDAPKAEGDPKSAEPNKGDTTPPKAQPNEYKGVMNLPKPDFTLTAVEITKSYMQDEDAARKKYDEKLIRVTGRIIEFNEKEWEIHLEGDVNQKVIARMGLNYRDTVKVKKVGDKITLQGKESSYRQKSLEIELCSMVPE